MLLPGTFLLFHDTSGPLIKSETNYDDQEKRYFIAAAANYL